MNKVGVDFFDFVERYTQHLSEQDPNHRNYDSDVVVWRAGQLFFNLLTEDNQRVAEMLRGSIFDPFHRDKVSDKTWNFVMDNWEG